MDKASGEKCIKPVRINDPAVRTQFVLSASAILAVSLKFRNRVAFPFWIVNTWTTATSMLLSVAITVAL